MRATAPVLVRRPGELTIHGLTGRVADHHWFIFNIGTGPSRTVRDMDVARSIRPIFDLSPVKLGGEVLNHADLMDLYQYAIRALQSGELICQAHPSTRLARDESCAACINEQTEGQE